MKVLFTVCLCLFFSIISVLNAQNAIVEGYIFESDNRGYLNEVSVTFISQITDDTIATATTNQEGFFSTELPINSDYMLYAQKDIFTPKDFPVTTIEKASGEKIFLKVEMYRKPGYLFELTLAEQGPDSIGAISVTNTKIEVYNHTTDELEYDNSKHPSAVFEYTLERGNRYTIMIRKKGYFNKRIEAFVDVEGCILCVDGVKNIGPGPGVADNLTEGFQMGTLLANLDLDRADLNKVMTLENIYYDYGKWNIRSDAAVELNKLITFLRENPSLEVEIGSHTDSRGQDDFNRKLSDKRAKAAVEYVIEKGAIAYERLSAKGYGESKLTNECKNGVKCSDTQHQKNRRTELKIVGFTDFDPYEALSLKNIIRREREEELLRQEVFNSPVIQIPEKPTKDKKSRRSERKKTLQAKSVAPAAEVPQVPKDFTGFKLQLLDSDKPLVTGHPLSKQFSNLTVYPISEDSYLYLIGNFQAREDATSFLKFVQDKFPKAKIISFKDGKLASP